jgi:hypothetical protein
MINVGRELTHIPLKEDPTIKVYRRCQRVFRTSEGK